MVHVIDELPCCAKAALAYAKAKAKGDKLGMRTIERLFNDWADSIDALTECRAHRVSLACGRAASWLHSWVGSVCPGKGSCAYDVKSIIDTSQKGIDDNCPKAEQMKWKWPKCRDFTSSVELPGF